MLEITILACAGLLAQAFGFWLYFKHTQTAFREQGQRFNETLVLIRAKTSSEAADAKAYLDQTQAQIEQAYKAQEHEYTQKSEEKSHDAGTVLKSEDGREFEVLQW